MVDPAPHGAGYEHSAALLTVDVICEEPGVVLAPTPRDFLQRVPRVTHVAEEGAGLELRSLQREEPKACTEMLMQS